MSTLKQPLELTSMGALLTQGLWAGGLCPSAACPFPEVNVQPAFGVHLIPSCMAFFVAFEFPWHHSDGPCFTERHRLCVLLCCGWARIFHRFHKHHFYSYSLNPQQAQISLAPCWAKPMPAEDLPCKLCVYITHACTHRGCLVFKVYTHLLICTVHLI